MLITVYIIQCKDDTYYTGMTNDLGRRLKEHECGYCRYTKKHGMKKVVYTEVLPDRKKARKREVYIKNRGAKRFLIVKKYSING